VQSHYERIRASKPVISGQVYNDAESGATMADALGQAGVAVSQGARYVTILMGARERRIEDAQRRCPHEHRAVTGPEPRGGTATVGGSG
jgi:hypothetical protein